MQRKPAGSLRGVVKIQRTRNQSEMSARGFNHVRTPVSATTARAEASIQRAQNARQMMADQRSKIAAMSQQERQQLMEKVQAQARATLARTQQARNGNGPVRDYAMKAPERGLPRSTHTAGVPRSRQPSNTTQAVQPISAAVRAQHSLLMSTAEYREATSAMLSQHGWSTLPADPQAITLFRERVEQVVRGKTRSRKSRQRRRGKRAHFRQLNATQQHSDY